MSNLNMSQQGKGYKQRYYRNIYTLNRCTPVLISVIVQFEHIAAGECFQTTILYDFFTLSLCRPVLLSGNVQSELAAAGESFKTKLLSDH